tara:strand:- start:209 stop:358 length:150 start_codon:yes stop_codon:yes gene_type:complete
MAVPKRGAFVGSGVNRVRFSSALEAAEYVQNIPMTFFVCFKDNVFQLRE